MKVVFTICSNNYLAKATILGNSIKQHEPNVPFFIFLCDKKIPEINYTTFADEVIPVGDIEPMMNELAAKYNIVELNTCIKPTVFEYLFQNRKAEKVIYLDPDIRVYHSLETVYQLLDAHPVVLTPHICSPIPIDGKRPAESMFNNFGIYNLGFIALAQHPEALRLLAWWKAHTYQQGFIDIYNGIFVDQLPMNHAHIFFDNVKVMKDPGMNMAPWNLHERRLEKHAGGWFVNGQSHLVFYHFSSFTPGKMELPQKYYDRFRLSDRTDLEDIYAQYDAELQAARNDFFEQFACSYAQVRAAAIKKHKQQKWPSKFKKLFRS